jgi:hypothetical protein
VLADCDAQECKYELVVSLLHLLDERDKAMWQNDSARVLDVTHDLMQIFPPNADATAQTPLYVHLYMRWRFPKTGEAHDFEAHVYANNAGHGLDVVYRRLFCVFLGFSGSSSDEDALFDAFLPYHHARYTALLSYAYALLPDAAHCYV